jgi:hypothetical protein
MANQEKGCCVDTPTLLDAWSSWTPGPRWKCYCCDEEHLKGIDGRIAPDSFDWDRFVAEQTFGRDDLRLHLNLTPIPFLGNPDKAKVVILLQNPGLSPTDYYGEFKVAGFQERLLKNLRGELSNDEYPFLFLDPQLSWHGGYGWWQKQLRSVIEVMSKVRGMAYVDARRELAQGIACIELMPYHSKSGFVSATFVANLPSANLARNYLQESLVPRAKNGEVVIIVPRHVAPWGFNRSSKPGEFEPPAGLSSDSCVLYGTELARSASMSATSPGGAAILRAFEVPPDRIPTAEI